MQLLFFDDGCPLQRDANHSSQSLLLLQDGITINQFINFLWRRMPIATGQQQDADRKCRSPLLLQDAIAIAIALWSVKTTVLEGTIG